MRPGGRKHFSLTQKMPIGFFLTTRDHQHPEMKQADPLTTTPPDYLYWLASFPRSGNTWVRNIFFEVFGMESGTWDVNDKGRVHELDCFSKPMVKTHMLPSQLIHDSTDKKAIYLVRDGRDAMVSIAHHRSDIIAPGSDFIDNMRTAILAEKGSFFGGWSGNVERWLERADLVVRYEDLLADTQGTLEKIRLFLELPEADYEKLPRFEDMKQGMPRYGSRGAKFSAEERKAHSNRFFRRGKSGAWCDEMPQDLHDLFWSIHGDTMLKMGYRYDGEMESTLDPDLDWKVAQLMGQPLAAPSEKFKITIEANELFSHSSHGVNRHLAVLLKEFLHVQSNPDSRWDFQLFANGRVLPLIAAQDALENSFKDTSGGLPTCDPDRVAEKTGRQPSKGIFKLIEKGARRMKASLLINARLQPATGARQGLAPADHAATFVEGSGDNHVIHLTSPLHYAPFSKARSPIVVTLRQLPHQSSKVRLKDAEGTWNFALNKNATFITTSKAAGIEAARLAGDQMPPVSVIHEAPRRTRFHRKSNGDDRQSACKKYGIPGKTPFFFTYSSTDSANELKHTVRAFLKLVQKDPAANMLLVVGGAARSAGLDFQGFAGFNPDKVLLTGFIQDEDLPYLLSEALAFCHVSAVEKLDLSVLEALNCGTPVIHGNNPTLCGTVGDAGLPAPPSDSYELSLRMEKILTDEKLRLQLQKAALQRASRFSSRRMAKETLQCYLETLKRHHKP